MITTFTSELEFNTVRIVFTSQLAVNIHYNNLDETLYSEVKIPGGGENMITDKLKLGAVLLDKLVNRQTIYQTFLPSFSIVVCDVVILE